MSNSPSTGPMWTCPTCGHRFAHRSQTHSCADHGVGEHLSRATRAVQSAYHALVQCLREFGDYSIHPVKTRIGFCNRMTFCAVWVRRNYLGGHLILDESPTSGRFTRGELAIVHRFRIRGPDDIDAEFRMYLGRAWERGLAVRR